MVWGNNIAVNITIRIIGMNYTIPTTSNFTQDMNILIQFFLVASFDLPFNNNLTILNE